MPHFFTVNVFVAAAIVPLFSTFSMTITIVFTVTHSAISFLIENSLIAFDPVSRGTSWVRTGLTGWLNSWLLRGTAGRLG